MVKLKDQSLESLLYKGKEQAHAKNESQLISITQRIKPIDPFLFFEAAGKLEENRTFWMSTKDHFTLVGIGNTIGIVADESRFSFTKNKWHQLLEQAIIENPYNEYGTGLLALGGMSFDPKREKSHLWTNFPASQFTIPKYVLIKNKDEYFFTTTVMVNGNDDLTSLTNELTYTKDKLLSAESRRLNDASVLKKSEIEPAQWKKTVTKAREEIRKGHAKKIVLAREMRLQLDRSVEPSLVLKGLYHSQPNSYIFAFEHQNDCFIGATPERLVRVEGEKVLSTCLAGTAPRGKTEEEDEKIADHLFNDHKNREEHHYVVQMIKKSIDKYCAEIDIPAQPVVYPLKNLQHLYTPVKATMKKGYSIFDFVKELHPTPALGGEPRQTSLKFIRENELLDRGWYGSPVGWIDSNGNGEFAVAIRSGLIQQDEASLFAGCGVMKDSDPEMEYEETNVKFLPMLNVLEGYNESY